MLRSATARAVAGALIHHQEACTALWQDLWSQSGGGGFVSSRSVLPLQCRGCGETAPVWVHQCAFAPLWVVWGARQYGVAQSHVGTTPLWTAVVTCLEGDSGRREERPGGWGAVPR